MNVIRALLSLFVVVLVVASLTGWAWTGSHQPPEKAAASRVVLTIGALAGAFGLLMIWRRQVE
jgi:hypothetical protein